MKILNNISLKVRNYFSIGHERSIKAKKNIFLLFITKGLSVIISLLLVPIVLHYLDTAKYGIWLTLTSIISWIYFFDIGLGNGLRNKFAEARAIGNIELARSYVSTTYAILTLVICSVFILFIIINFSLDWVKILNAPVYLKREINLLVIITFSFFCLGFITKLLDTILVADQRPGISSIISLIGNLLSLVLIYLLTKFTSGSLILAGTVLSASAVFIYLISAVYFFAKDYKDIRPSIKTIDWKLAPELMGLGIKFFVIQISVLVIFTTSNLIITQLFGPSQVTVYNISYKYFGVIPMVFGIIAAPFWSAYTEAYTKNDFEWIKKMTYKLLRVWLIFALAVIIMILFSKNIYALWVGSEIHIPLSLSIFMGVFVLILTYDSIFISFINGIGKVKLQLYLSVISAISLIPFAILFGKILNFGLTGVIIAICVVLAPSPVLVTIQYLKIINKTAKGIWNK